MYVIVMEYFNKVVCFLCTVLYKSTSRQTRLDAKHVHCTTDLKQHSNQSNFNVVIMTNLHQKTKHFMSLIDPVTI